jgi:RNA polymerase sigma-70 factor, ECF subfamily
MTADADIVDVDGVLAGDLAAFERVVRRWQGPLVNLAFRFCHDRGRAEDLAQEAFLRAYRGLGRWRREAAFSTWLFALATNVYRSELRRLPPPSVSFDLVPEPSSGERDAASVRLEAADRDRVVRRAVDTLPAKYRDALILFYFRGMDVAAAAETLGVPTGTLKARLSRARDLLRRKLPPQRELPRLTEAS